MLLPLVNAPMLDYTLEWLASNEVEEVFLFCCSNADKIQEYVNSTKWGAIPGFDVKVVVSTNCFSAGEAMRLIDQQDVIKGGAPPSSERACAFCPRSRQWVARWPCAGQC